MGTPHRGTRLAWAGAPLAFLAPCILQMLPGSRFLRRLHEGPWPARVALLSIRSRRDRVAPYHAAAPAADAPGVRDLEVDAAHRDYLLKAAVYAELRRALAAGAELPAPVQRAA
jgi:hypothetical protein